MLVCVLSGASIPTCSINLLVIFQWSDHLTQPVRAQAVSDFLLQYDNSLFFFVSELMGLLLTGEDQSQADQPNNLAEGHPM